MTQDEVTKWEKENQSNITGWQVEYDIKPGYKTVTYTMSDKTKKKFEIKIK